MIRMVVVTLAMLLAPAGAVGQTLADALDREAQVLRAEKQALERALAEALESTRVARESLIRSIEESGAELVRLRAENARQERSLPERERIKTREAQMGELEEIREQVRGWLEVEGEGAEGGLVAAIEQVESRGRLHRALRTVFDREGRADRRQVLRLGRVGALAEDRPLIPVGEDFREVAVPSVRGESQHGVTQTVVLFDPEDPSDIVEQRGLRAWLRAGGPLLWPIILLGVLALLVVVERTARLSWVTLRWRAYRDELRDCEAKHDWERAAQAALVGRPRALAQPFIDILGARDLPAAKLEERATESLLKLRPHLQRRLTVLGVTAAVSPLLGLLGTVTGMISTFSAITAHGTGDPQLLSDGISEALITTQLGLAVAVPALLLHTGLLRWASALFTQVEDTCVGLLHHIEDLELPGETAVHHENTRHVHG